MSNLDYSVLTQVGPGTPMGKLLRRYWVPAAVSEEVLGKTPVRIKLLGERLVAYRDQNNRVGLIGEFCAHRGASLAYGRHEGDGLRCLYHGWKTCATGEILETPAEPEQSRLRKNVRAKAYPTKEAGGIVWTYMGPAELEPPFPHYPWFDLPSGHVLVCKIFQDCNYLQGVEGDFDPAHANFLHRDFEAEASESWSGAGWNSMAALMEDASPRLQCESTPYGMHFAAIRKTSDASRSYVRVYETIAPFYSYIPSGVGESQLFKAWHPIDDLNCFTFYVHFDPARPIDVEGAYQNWGHRTHPPDFKTPSNNMNMHLQDRDRMEKNYSGIPGAAVQDIALQESMGSIYDRNDENLGACDGAVTFYRQMLLRMIRENEAGHTIPQYEGTRDRTLRGASVSMPVGEPWQDAVRWQEREEAATR